VEEQATDRAHRIGRSLASDSHRFALDRGAGGVAGGCIYAIEVRSKGCAVIHPRELSWCQIGAEALQLPEN
jgi:hypothetical protein